MSKAATIYLEITENRFNFIYTTRNLLRYLLVFVKSVMHKFDIKYTARYKRRITCRVWLNTTKHNNKS